MPILPSKNNSALIGYYFGVFSLIPFVGVPLGVVAMIFGVKGLKFAKANPAVKGAGHAWTAIILGGLCLIGHIVAASILIGLIG